jgi:ribosome-associated protein
MNKSEHPNTSAAENNFELNGDVIELYKLLKAASLAASGGEAKYFIAEGLVRVNGQAETRKRKKILDGDCVEFNGQTINVVAPKIG